MTHGTTLSCKDLLSGLRLGIEPICIRRWLKGIYVQCERIQGFIRESRLNPLRIWREHVIRTEVGRFGVAHEGGITHQVPDIAVQMCRGVIDILAVLDADEIRDL